MIASLNHHLHFIVGAKAIGFHSEGGGGGGGGEWVGAG